MPNPFDPSQEFPPHVCDDAPLRISSAEHARDLVARFRWAAQQFRASNLSDEEFGFFPLDCEEYCGHWLIEASEAGLIPSEQSQLLDLIAWHISKEPDVPGFQYVRSPSNLVTAICDGDSVSQTCDGDGKGFAPHGQIREDTALMSRLFPSHCKMARKGKWAAMCEWLARLIEDSRERPADGSGDAYSVPSVADLAAESYATLDQAAAMVSRSKKTLERLLKRKTNPIPDPDVEGGGGKPHEWKWSKIRPWLEREFKKQLPARMPTLSH